MLTAEQQDLRESGIGASECAAACGLSKYEQTFDLYRKKTGEADPVELNRDILFGQFMESGGIRYWEALRETPVEYPLPTVRHPKYPYMLATPDAKIGPRRGLEFKTMDFFRFRQLEMHGIAEVIPEYLLQVQHQMECMDWDSIVIAIMVGKDLHDVEVERNERLQSVIVEREGVFWDHVERRVPPEIDFSRGDSLRCVQALYPEVTNDLVVTLSDDASAQWKEYEALGKTIKDANERRDSIKARVLAEIGDNYAGLLSGSEKMLRRKWVEPTSYTVERKGYFDFRAVKYDGSTILGESETD